MRLARNRSRMPLFLSHGAAAGTQVGNHAQIQGIDQTRGPLTSEKERGDEERRGSGRADLGA